MKLSIIVAVSENGVIGRDGELPWHLPDELRHLKRTTMGHTLLMGRKTYASIGRPLPGRTSIVVSRDRAYDPHPEVLVVHDVPAGIALARQRGEQELFVFGGESLYRDAISSADRVYLTRVHAVVDGDAYFPDLDPEAWKLVSEERHEADARHDHAFSRQRFEATRRRD